MNSLSSFDRFTSANGTVYRCYCCNDFLQAEDFRPDMFRDGFGAAVEELNGGRVCVECMDAHVETEEGDVVAKDDATKDADGYWHSDSSVWATTKADTSFLRGAW